MAREKVDLIICRANELVTLRDNSHKAAEATPTRRLGLIENGAVAVQEGNIVAVGKSERIEQRYKAEQVVDASGKVVLPGFVDSHTHLVFAGAREEEFELRVKGLDYMEILARGGGILKTVQETRSTSQKQLVESGRKTLDIMLQHGTTTVEAKSGYGLTTQDEIKCLQAAKKLGETHSIDVVPTFLGAHAIPTEYKGKADEYVDLVTEEMIPKVAASGLAEFCDVFCETGVFSVKQARRVLLAGREHGLKPKIHADELSYSSGAELAAEVSAVSAEHLLFASEKGLRAMGRAGTVAVLLPTASFSLMTGKYASARRIKRFDVPVALGTDFNPSCWTENMQTAISFACRAMHLTPAEAIAASTITAAYAIGRAQEVGSIEEGKKADMIILGIPNHKFLGYRFGVNLVEEVFKKGILAVENS